MKKLICLTLCASLCAMLLSGCSMGKLPDDPSSAADGVPQSTEAPVARHGEEDQSKAVEGQPTLEPVQTIEPDGAPQDDYFSLDALQNNDDNPNGDPGSGPDSAPADPGAAGTIDTSTYQFSALTDTSLGFTFNYPSHWENVPGIYSVCFREKVDPGDFPARVVITAKKLTFTPEEYDITEQLTSYMRTVYKQYNADTFQAGTPNTTDTFMGEPAYSNVYRAYAGDTEVRGFVIGCAIKRRMYVFHFCAAYSDYVAMETMMRYMIRSVQPVAE